MFVELLIQGTCSVTVATKKLEETTTLPPFYSRDPSFTETAFRSSNSKALLWPETYPLWKPKLETRSFCSSTLISSRQRYIVLSNHGTTPICLKICSIYNIGPDTSTAVKLRIFFHFLTQFSIACFLCVSSSSSFFFNYLYLKK